jgi:hypothetical protein
VHGDADYTVPLASSIELATALLAAVPGADVELEIAAGATHIGVMLALMDSVSSGAIEPASLRSTLYAMLADLVK